MKVYLTPPQPSRGLQRIADALTRYKPDDVEVVDDAGGADLLILYAIGRQDALRNLTLGLRPWNQRYAVVQICLRSTKQPSTEGWREIWDGASVVWSYYDLNAAIRNDGGIGTGGNFYHAPLGADAEVFQPDRYRSRHKDYVIASSGLSRLSESVRECAIAAEQVNRSVFHVGPELRLHGHVIYADGRLTDQELAICYSACEFVSGLRRKEGFELPAVEGLLCGARPIVFDTPDYHWCYGDHAEYIQETDRQGVVDQLIELFKRGARPVTLEERERAVERYNWETIIGGFYERLK